MKIRVLTFSAAPNYGALLQAYALCKVLKNNGCQVELFRLSLFKPSVINYFKKYFRIRFVQRFQKKYLPPFVEMQSVADADCYIVGSDQVWNPKFISNVGYAFFFDFLPEGCKRISYAASMGDDWFCTEEQRNKIIFYLEKFSRISLRESFIIPRFEQLFGITPQQVALDPTLLLTDYTAITGEYSPRNTLISFKFNQSPSYYTLVNQLAQEEGLKLRRLDAHYFRYKGKEYVTHYCSVGKWVKEIAQSRFVVTDSFHGMVFSIIHKKKFVVFPSHAPENKRAISLLKLLGLEGRYYSSYDAFSQSEEWRKDIDYSLVDEKLAALRKDSLGFLLEAIAK